MFIYATSSRMSNPSDVPAGLSSLIFLEISIMNNCHQNNRLGDDYRISSPDLFVPKLSMTSTLKF